MTRIGKDEERRHFSPRKRKKPSAKSGPRKDNLPQGFKVHRNALEGTILATKAFIPVMR